MVSNDLESLKTEIRSVLIANKKGLTEQELKSQFRDFCFKSIPYKNFGYAKLSTFLESLSDVVRISEVSNVTIYSVIPNEETKHISKLVQSQNNSKGNNGVRKPSAKEEKIKKCKSKRLPSDEMTMIKDVILKFPRGLDEDLFDNHFQESFYKPLEFKKYGFHSYKECFESIPHIIQIRSRGKQHPYWPSKALMEESNKSRGSTKVPNKTSIPESIIQNLDTLMAESITGSLYTDNFLLKYEERFGTQLKFQDYGFLNLLQLFRHLPMVFELEKEGSRNRLRLPEMKNHKPKESLSVMSDNIVSVLLTEKKIILSTDLADLYFKHHGRRICPNFYGVQSMDELLLKLSNHQHSSIIMEEIANSRYLVKLLPSKVASTRNFSSKQPNSPLLIRKLELPKSDSEPELVFVEQFYSPLNLYFRYVKYEPKLSKLTENLNKFCKQNKSSLKMVEDDIRPGNTVAVFIDKTWYRGEICELSKSEEVNIFSIDYGRFSMVSTDRILRLGTDFFELPAQAVKARLANYQHQQLNSDLTEDVCSLLQEVPLHCSVISSESGLVVELFQSEGTRRAGVRDCLKRRTNSTNRETLTLRRPYDGTRNRLENKSNNHLEAKEILLSNIGLKLQYILGFDAFKSEPVVTSLAICNLFPKWKGKNILDKMLEYKKIHFDSVTIKRKEHSNLWSLAESANLQGFTGESVVLFRLLDVSRMIDFFSKEHLMSLDISEAFKNLGYVSNII